MCLCVYRRGGSTQSTAGHHDVAKRHNVHGGHYGASISDALFHHPSSAATFRQRTCTKTWPKISSYLTLVILSRPIRIVGKFKSETGSLAPFEFVGLRAKMYSLLVPANPKECKIRAKGIKKSYLCKEESSTRSISECLENAETYS